MGFGVRDYYSFSYKDSYPEYGKPYYRPKKSMVIKGKKRSKKGGKRK